MGHRYDVEKVRIFLKLLGRTRDIPRCAQRGGWLQVEKHFDLARCFNLSRVKSVTKDRRFCNKVGSKLIRSLDKQIGSGFSPHIKITIAVTRNSDNVKNSGLDGLLDSVGQQRAAGKGFNVLVWQPFRSCPSRHDAHFHLF